MIAILARASLRHGLRHPWQALLAALGIALGVAVVTAIDLTQASAKKSFADASESVVGKATHHIMGGPLGLDEALYVELRRAGMVRKLAPVIEAKLRLPDHSDTSIRLLGVDPIAEGPLRGYWSQLGDASEGITALITKPGTALISRAAAQRLHVVAGEVLRGEHAGQSVTLEVMGVLGAAGRSPALAGTELAIVDIATAQEILRMAGRLSRIDLILESDSAIAAVRSALGSEAALVAAERRIQSVAQMTRAFHTNLTALSLLALLVGMFLIYNSQTFMVIQRREQFGMLRALGVSRHQLAAMVLAEAAVLGVLGTVSGLALGVELARGLIGLVTQTINDLYFTLSVSGIALEPRVLITGILLGLGGSLAATLVPAREATRVEPRAAMSRAELEARAGTGAGVALKAGLGLAAGGGLILLIPSKALVLGFFALFLVIFGFALMSPALTVALARALQMSDIARQGFAMRLAIRAVTTALSRTGVAVAALMVAVATTIGIGIMVGSFRASVNDWLASLLTADFYVSLASSATAGAAGALSTDLVADIATIAGVRGASHVRRVNLTSKRHTDAIAVYQLNDAARRGFRFRAIEDQATFWQRFEREDVVMVTESYAYHHGLVPGGRITLRTDEGGRHFEIAAVYQDYASERGTIAMSRTTYDRHWRDAGVTGIGIYIDAGFDLAQFRRRLAELVGDDRGLEVIDNRAIREVSMGVFDRTFTITEVLRLLAGIIAFIGVFGALMAIQLERARELAILKAVGVTPGQIRRIVVGETALIGGAAGLLAIPVGLVIALLLIYVINRRAFGWTMALELDAGILAGGFMLALLAALLAGLYPAIRMARAQPADVLRIE